MRKITWRQIQINKRSAKIRNITKEVLTALAIIIGMLFVMAWAGGTYPY